MLLDKCSFGHSVGLSILVIEECGKALFLFAGYEGTTVLDKEFNKILQKHEVKIYTSLLELALSERSQRMIFNMLGLSARAIR